MTWHSFSFGPHYDPDRVGFGPMLVHDDHLLGNGQGFETHHHERVEIVTWVLSGALTHTDSTGATSELRPGSVGILSAGAGVDHSEIAAAPQTRFVQVWLTSDDPDRTPSYAVVPVSVAEGRFTEVAAPVAGASFAVARLAAGESVTLPEARLRHLFVASGALLRNSLAEPLAAGDAYEIGPDAPADQAGDPASAPAPVVLTAGVPTELLLWSFS